MAARRKKKMDEGKRSGPDIFVLYQMGSSEEYVWYSVVAVFLSREELFSYAARKGIDDALKLLPSPREGAVLLKEPVEFVAVESTEGEVPDVELEDQDPS